jgi:hypothetical protein
MVAGSTVYAIAQAKHSETIFFPAGNFAESPAWLENASQT